MHEFIAEEEETERDIPPEFKTLIRDTNAIEGEPATFDCQVTGRPKPTVEWQKVCQRYTAPSSKNLVYKFKMLVKLNPIFKLKIYILSISKILSLM